MHREAGARRGVHFNPECLHSILNTVWCGLKSEPKNKARSTRKCMLENWDLTLTFEVATSTKCCVESS